MRTKSYKSLFFALLGVILASGSGRGLAKSVVSLPPGVKAVWDLNRAYREATPTRERVCINGLWRWQPAGDLSETAPASADFLKAGGNLLAVELDESDANAFLPTPVRMKQAEHIAALFMPFGKNSLLAGVSPADVHNRDPHNFPLVAGGADVIGDGILAKHSTTMERKMAMERKSRFCLTSYTVLLLAGAVSAGAQGPPPAQPGQGGPGEPARRAPGQQPGPGGFGVGQNRFGSNPGGMPMAMMNPMIMKPEMATRMMSNMALRQINGIGLTSRDISTALPTLKTMRDAEKTQETRAIQILDEEKKALLSAEPDSPPLPDSGQRMQEITQASRQQIERGWETISNAIGRDKAGGLRNLVEGGGMIGPGGPGRPGGFGGPLPPGARPGQPGQFGNDIGPAGGALQPPQPRNRGGGADRPREGALQPPQPGNDARFAPDAQALPPGGPQVPPQGGQGGGVPGGGQNPFGVRPGQQAQGQGFPGQRPGVSVQGMPGMAFGGPRISLADLVDLLEQKQAAMRR